MANQISAAGRKRLLVGGYFAAQAFMFVVAWPVFFNASGSISLSEWPWGMVAWMSVWMLMIMALQSAFLLPIHHPARQSAAVGAGVRPAIAAFAVSTQFAMVVLLVGSIALLWIRRPPPGAMSALWWGAGAIAALGGLAFVPVCYRKFRGSVPMRLSLVVAAFAIGLMIGAFFAAIKALTPDAAILQRDDQGSFWAIGVAVAILLGWAVSTPLLMSFSRGREPEQALSRIASALFVGTVIEAAAILPLDIMVRRKTSCYCEEGTFWALSMLWSVGLLALGPAIFLLPARRRLVRISRGRCGVCGYDMSGTPRLERCPECGAGWKTDG